MQGIVFISRSGRNTKNNWLPSIKEAAWILFVSYGFLSRGFRTALEQLFALRKWACHGPLVSWWEVNINLRPCFKQLQILILILINITAWIGILNSYYVSKSSAKYFLFSFNVQETSYTYKRAFSIWEWHILSLDHLVAVTCHSSPSCSLPLL